MAEQEKETQSDEEKVQELQSQQASYESEKSRKQSTKDANSAKIDRLKVVKSTLEEEKGYAKDRISVLKKAIEEDGLDEWAGNKKTTLLSDINNTILPEYERYVDRIDEVLDEVCNEITRLENENLSLGWDIFNLASAINSLINQIATYFN